MEYIVQNIQVQKVEVVHDSWLYNLVCIISLIQLVFDYSLYYNFKNIIDINNFITILSIAQCSKIVRQNM